VRVIAGRFKGRRLKTPSWEGLRPTSDKVRETLFNILAPRISGTRVFDGFAGTGAVGIEALSRGAAHVTFAERDRRAATLIAANLALCGVEEGYTIECGDAATVLQGLSAGAPFDLILLDPPYELESAAVTAAVHAAAGRVAADGIIVLERPTRRTPEVPAGLQRVRDVASGDTTLTIMQRET
jgi:16S rRNA (guanine966-N2)-methyltransferase